MSWRGVGNGFRSTPGSWIGRLMAKPHPDAFTTGVRVVNGELAGEGARWRFRISAVDPYRADGLVTVTRGRDQVLRLRVVDDEVGPGARPAHGTITADETGSGARLQVSAPLGDLWRFGVDVR